MHSVNCHRNSILLADTVGLLPGGSAALKFGSAGFSGVVSAWRGDLTGAGLGYAELNSELFGPSGAGRGSQAARLLPFAGQLVSAFSLSREILKTGSEILDCPRSR